MLLDSVERAEDALLGCFGDERDAELLEIADAFEVAAVLFAHFEDSSMFAFERHVGEEMLAANLGAFLDRDRGEGFVVEEQASLQEDPGIADGAAADEDAVNTIGIEGRDGLLRSDDVAVAEDRDVHVGVVFDGSDE